MVVDGHGYFLTRSYLMLWIVLWFRPRGNGGEKLEVFWDLSPLLRISLCENGGVRVGVVAQDVLLQTGGNKLGWILNDSCEELGIGLVCQLVSAGKDARSSVKVAVRNQTGG
jgi:hypothetical protein